MATIYLLGVGCAHPTHPRGWVEHHDHAALLAFRTAYRCPRCDGGNVMTGPALVRERVELDEPPPSPRLFGL